MGGGCIVYSYHQPTFLRIDYGNLDLFFFWVEGNTLRIDLIIDIENQHLLWEGKRDGRRSFQVCNECE